MGIREEIARYRPFNEQEARDKAVMLAFLEQHDDAFLRSNRLGHMRSGRRRACGGCGRCRRRSIPWSFWRWTGTRRTDSMCPAICT